MDHLSIKNSSKVKVFKWKVRPQNASWMQLHWTWNASIQIYINIWMSEMKTQDSTRLIRQNSLLSDFVSFQLYVELSWVSITRSGLLNFFFERSHLWKVKRRGTFTFPAVRLTCKARISNDAFFPLCFSYKFSKVQQLIIYTFFLC